MLVRFWGTRGSIACPGPDTVRYGGNTTCIEVRTDAGDVLIYDGGTGIRKLGLSLLGQGPIECHILLTHTHWDHIQGLPFFVPLFIPGSKVHFHGPADPVYQRSLKDLLAGQFDYAYFPVTEGELNAEITYTNVVEGQSFQLGSSVITPVRMNHPVVTFGYRIDADGSSVFFTGDHEPLHNIYEKDDPHFQDYEELIETKRQSLLDPLQGVHTLIGDTMYTEEEYPSRIGWGHGTTLSNLEFSRKVDAKRLVLTHHDPERTDDQLDVIHHKMQEIREDNDPEVVIAAEGMTLNFNDQEKPKNPS